MDTRGPPDFSGNANTKLDDMGYGDDKQDEDDDIPSRSMRRRGLMVSSNLVRITLITCVVLLLQQKTPPDIYFSFR